VSAAALGTFLAAESALGSPSSQTVGVLSLLLAALCAGATEFQLASSRLSGNGGQAASSFWAVAFGIAAVGFLFDSGNSRTITLILAAGVLLWTAACRRWGYPAYAALAVVFAFLLLARLEGGRLLWLAVGAALVFFSAPLLDRADLSPSHRRSFRAVLAVSLFALYAAINLYSLDETLIEIVRFDSVSSRPASAALRLLSALATAFFPLLLGAWAIRSRRTLLLDVAIATAALSLLTFQHYARLRPLWAVLVSAGGLVLGTSLLLARKLALSPLREVRGFTGNPLFEELSQQLALELAAATATWTPATASAPQDRQGFEGGGGKFGGGGAGGKF